MSDIDVFRSANLLITHFGDAALDVAEQRIAGFEALNHKEGIQIWTQIKKALDQLLSQTPSKNTFMH